MVTCPKCSRSVPEKRTCLYCGALLDARPQTVSGMNAEAWIREGVRVAKMNQNDRALKCFDTALTIDPKSAITWYNRALVLVRMERFDEALIAVDRALAIWPTDPDMLRFRETLVGSGAPGGASAKPAEKSAAEWINEGTSLAHARNLEGALACFERGLKLDPGRVIGWFNRGMVLADLGRMREALASLDHAMLLAPGEGSIAEARNKVARDPRVVLPPGRPWKTAMDMLAEDGAQGAYFMSASSSIFTVLRRFEGPAQIAAMNYIVNVPRAAEWNVQQLGDEGVLFHVLVRDKTAYSFRYDPDGREAADALVRDVELEAYGALLAAGTLARIMIGANLPFGPRTAARVAALNLRLFRAGIPEPGRVELLHVPHDR